MMDAEFSSFETEMNRGFLQILALVALERKMYGYGMIKHLEAAGYAVEENTLYPLLRRLEKNGWIASEWDVSEDRPKKFYVITEKGKVVRAQALKVWAEQSGTLKRMAEVDRDV
jgi:PadR family transcriptional regulator PadR